MNDQELESKNILISGIEDKGWGISISDAKGLKYNIPKFLKGTQNETKAFQVLKALPGYGIGVSRCVKFATVSNSQGGTSRYVRIIGEVEEEGQKAINTHYEPKQASTGLPGAYKAIVEPKQTSQSDEIRQNVVLKMVSEILAAGVIPLDQWKEWADKFYFYSPTKPIMQKLNEAGLTKSQEEEISLEDQVKDIPF